MVDDPNAPSLRGFAIFALMMACAVVVGVAVGVAIFGPVSLPANTSGETAVGTEPGPTVIEINLVEFEIIATRDSVDSGSIVEFDVTNDGKIQHDFKINGEEGVGPLEPGGGSRLRVGPVTETIRAWCTVPGHRDAGMEVTISVS